MKFALGISCLSVLALLFPRPAMQAQDQRTPVSVPAGAAQDPTSHAARALAGLRQTTAALKEWRAAAEGGAVVNEVELRDLREALQAMGEEFQALYSRSQAQAVTRAPAREQRAAAPVKDRALMSKAHPISRAWVDDLHALGERAQERREAGLKAVRDALAGTDPVAQLAALQTLSESAEIAFDKAPFRALVLPFARDAQGELAPAALYALSAVGREPGDVELVYSAWVRAKDAMSERALHLLTVFGDNRLEGRSEEIALELLAEVGQRSNMQLNGMWGARVGPRLEARVLELARSSDRDVRHNAIYFGLSTFAEKSEAVVDALIETLADPDWNNSGRALWGLEHEVPVALQPKVAAALVELHNSRSDPRVREDCVRIVKRYGGPSYEARLAR
jgi:hypothetical protein